MAVLQKHLATLNSIIGAICAYLLIGLAWAIIYLAVDRLDHEAIAFSDRAVASSTDEGVAKFSQVVYFSFVTMSTLGYGDITPQSEIAQTLAWMESVTGLFYMAIVVAWLISEIPRRDRAS
jgi:hypothetical protein